MNRTTNPLLRLRGPKRGASHPPEVPGAATVRGTVVDAAVLCLIVLLGTAYPLQRALTQPVSAEVLATLGAAVMIIFGAGMYVRRAIAPFVAAVYAFGTGLFAGGMSAWLEREAGGAWGLTALAPVAVFTVLLWVYGVRLVDPEHRRRMFVHGLIGSLFLLQMASFALVGSRPDLETLAQAPPLQILAVVLVAAGATVVYQLDFATIDRGLKLGAPRRFQWFCAVGLVTGIVWCVPESLRQIVLSVRPGAAPDAP